MGGLPVFLYGGPIFWSLYRWLSMLTAVLKLTISSSSTLLPAHASNVFSARHWLRALSGNEASGTSRCFACMRTRYLCAASIYCISNRAPKRLSNSFINQGLQVQPFQKPIRNSVYVLGFFTAQGARKHKNVGEG